MSEPPPHRDDEEEWGPLVIPRRCWWRSRWVLVGGCLVLGYGVLAPLFLGSGGHGEIANVRMNAMQVVHALSAFKEDYGSYPNEGTITEVLKRHPAAKGLLGNNSANDFFRQLLVAGYVDGEGPFFMGYRSHDEIAKDKVSGKMLEAGECAFSYVVRDRDEPIPQRAPVLLAPLIPGQLVFDAKLSDKKLFNRKVIVGYSDGSIQVHRINKDGKLLCGGGKDFFDPSMPHWGGKVPRIAWPE